ALPARGELGVEDVGLVAGLEDDRPGRRSLGEGGLPRARDRGDSGPPGLFLLRADVFPGREGAGMGTPVGFVAGPGETVEIGTGHQSIMPEQRGDDATGDDVLPRPFGPLLDDRVGRAHRRRGWPARYQRGYLGWGMFVLMER